MAERQCNTCRFFVSGECYRYPPRVVVVPSVMSSSQPVDGHYRLVYETTGAFPSSERPKVNWAEFCGEWQDRNPPKPGDNAAARLLPARALQVEDSSDGA